MYNTIGIVTLGIRLALCLSLGLFFWFCAPFLAKIVGKDLMIDSPSNGNQNAEPVGPANGSPRGLLETSTIVQSSACNPPPLPESHS